VVHNSTMLSLLDRVDHLVYTTPDLDHGVYALEQLLGVRATAGGQHPGRGTRNALIAIGPRTYIEIIGPDRDQPPPVEPRPFGIDALTAPRLVTWVANTSDLDQVSQRATSAGIPLGALGEGQRTRPDGVLLKWRYTDPRVVVADGIVPFFIDWGTTPHPAVSSVSGGRLVALRAQHPDASPVSEQLNALGLVLPVTQGDAPALIATIHGPRGRVQLR
jgi:hypothetical protein